MYKIGDKVKFKKSSINTGMCDATESDVFEVSKVGGPAHIQLRDVIYSLTGWWNVTHFEHVKEELMNNTEEQEIKWEGNQIDWQVGQEVFCILRGKGVIANTSYGSDYPIEVEFEKDFEYYTNDGKLFDYHKNRTLFFSEPVITAELFPPKKPFVPTLKEGDEVLIEGPRGGQIFRREVKEETEDKVICKYAGEFEKIGYKFTKLGEEIKFS